MKSKFNGDRLKKARIYRGITVAELAEKVSLQRQTLSMYEINKSQPSEEIASCIANVLNFPKAFFYEEFIVPSLGTVYFRSLLTTNKKYRVEQSVKMEFLSQVYAFLQEYIEFPLLNIPSFPEDILPEDAALILRKHWNLGLSPIDNLISIVEQNGILVTSFSTSTDDVDAFSQPVVCKESSTFLIAYSNNKTSAARIHFDIAHELGHICLHEWSDDIEELSREEFKKREQEANDFAAAFLMPKETFKKEVSSISQSLVPYKHLKRKWKVSIAAMIRRAKDIGVISSEEYQLLIRVMQRRGQRKEEPLDDVLMTASPALLKAAVLMLLQENVFKPKEFMDELSKEYRLSINAEEIEYLLDLPCNTLSSNNIIDFNSALQIKQERI